VVLCPCPISVQHYLRRDGRTDREEKHQQAPGRIPLVRPPLEQAQRINMKLHDSPPEGPEGVFSLLSRLLRHREARKASQGRTQPQCGEQFAEKVEFVQYAILCFDLQHHHGCPNVKNIRTGTAFLLAVPSEIPSFGKQTDSVSRSVFPG